MVSPSIDHHIQGHIVDQLFRHGILPFSVLQPAGIENSLFMYHVKKLITRGIVEKHPEGFQLTTRGVRWANESGANYHPLHTPRPLIQLFAVQDDDILISERADHLAAHTNRYMLPGGVHTFGKTNLECAEHIASKFGLLLATKIPIGTSEYINTTTSHHAIVTYYEATPPPLEYTYHDDVFVTSFMPLVSIRQHNTLLDQVVKKYQQHQLPFSITLKH